MCICATEKAWDIREKGDKTGTQDEKTLQNPIEGTKYPVSK